MDIIEMQESLSRCDKILVGAINLEEIIGNIKKSIKPNYTLEDCYKDLLTVAVFKWQVISELIIYLIESSDLESVDIIIKNLHFLNPICLVELMCKNNKLMKLVEENFSYIFEKLNDETKNAFILELNKTEFGKDLLMKEIKNNLIKKAGSSGRKTILGDLFYQENGIQVIIENFDNFFADGFDFDILQIMMKKGVSSEEILNNKQKILKKSYGLNIISFIDWLHRNGNFEDSDISLKDFIGLLYHDITDKQTVKMLEVLYKELLDKQNLKITDIQSLGQGNYSKVCRIGMFSLKIGEKRETNLIPYHRRILQPLLRQEINPGDEKNNIYIEIQNVTDNKWYKGMSDEQITEQLYKIYAEMRKDGIVWTDIKKTNVGRLIRPNKSNYIVDTLVGDINDSSSLKIIKKELEISDQAVGIVNRVNEECLKPGELVIFDTDFIFNAKDINIAEELNSVNPPKFIAYEKRYLKELKEKSK